MAGFKLKQQQHERYIFKNENFENFEVFEMWAYLNSPERGDHEYAILKMIAMLEVPQNSIWKMVKNRVFILKNIYCAVMWVHVRHRGDDHVHSHGTSEWFLSWRTRKWCLEIDTNMETCSKSEF